MFGTFLQKVFEWTWFLHPYVYRVLNLLWCIWDEMPWFLDGTPDLSLPCDVSKRSETRLGHFPVEIVNGCRGQGNEEFPNSSSAAGSVQLQPEVECQALNTDDVQDLRRKKEADNRPETRVFSYSKPMLKVHVDCVVWSRPTLRSRMPSAINKSSSSRQKYITWQF